MLNGVSADKMAPMRPGNRRRDNASRMRDAGKGPALAMA